MAWINWRRYWKTESCAGSTRWKKSAESRQVSMTTRKIRERSKIASIRRREKQTRFEFSIQTNHRTDFVRQFIELSRVCNKTSIHLLRAPICMPSLQDCATRLFMEV